MCRRENKYYWNQKLYISSYLSHNTYVLKVMIRIGWGGRREAKAKYYSTGNWPKTMSPFRQANEATKAEGVRR